MWWGLLASNMAVVSVSEKYSEDSDPISTQKLSLVGATCHAIISWLSDLPSVGPAKHYAILSVAFP